MWNEMATKKNAGQTLVAMRNAKLTPEERKAIASKAAKARWAKKTKKKS